MRFPRWKWIAGSVALAVTAAALAFPPDDEAEATSVSAKTGKGPRKNKFPGPRAPMRPSSKARRGAYPYG